MNKNLKRFIKILICITFLLISFSIIVFGLLRKETYNKYKTFIKTETDYDVLFFGTSHVLNSVFPMQLWNDYGITSYNMAYHSFGIPLNYYFIRQSILYHKPSAIMIDILGIDKSYKDSKASLTSFHNAFDPITFSKIKTEAAIDIFPEVKERIETLFPFYTYHNRWNEENVSEIVIEGSKFLRGQYTPYATKGADLRIAVQKNEFFEGMRNISKYAGEKSTALEYLEKIIEFCKEENIIPILMFIPYSDQCLLNDWKNEIILYSNQNNIDFLDMSENVVDFEIDQYDLNSHLNPSGARKVTACIGKFLKEEKGFISHKNDINFANWNEDYQEYRTYLIETIKNQDDFNSFLMMLNNSEVMGELLYKENVVFTNQEHKLIYENGSNIKIKITAQDQNNPWDMKLKVYETASNKILIEKDFITSRVVSSLY